MGDNRLAMGSYVLVCLCVVFLPSQAFAQSAIAGGVKDTSGAQIPGVTVEAASPSLIEKVRAVVTDDQGLYKIINLQPGIYSVTFTLPGFNTVKREGIELSTSFTATVNAELRPGAIEETITVTGAAPVVDVQSVKKSEVLKEAVTEALPTGRAPEAFAPFIPGVVGGIGVSQRDASNLSIHGSRNADSNQALDGVATHSLEGSGGQSKTYYVNQGYIDEISIDLSSLSAENQNGGIWTRMILKEGGNQIKGSFVAAYQNDHFVANNLTPELIQRGLTNVNGPAEVWDYNASLGGPLAKDRLWFFSSMRLWGATNFIAGLYYNATPTAWTYTPDTTRQAVTKVADKSFMARATWQATSRNKFALFYDYQPHCTCHRGFSSTTSPEATEYTLFPNNVIQATWKSPRTTRLFLEAGGTIQATNWVTNRQPGVDANAVSVTDQIRRITFRAAAPSGGPGGAGYGNHHNNLQTYQASASYVTGSHNFKTGMQLVHGVRDNDRDVGQASYSVTLRDGVTQSLTLWATPLRWVDKLNADFGLYTQDQWTMKRMTLNMGVRWDYFNGSVPEQHLPAGRFVPARDYAAVKNVPNWNDLSPRLGVSYDLFGDGRTAVKTGVSRYVAGQTVNIANQNNPVTRSIVSATRNWIDANNDFIPDCNFDDSAQNGECQQLSNPNFGKGNPNTVSTDDDVNRGFGVRPGNWEAFGSIQHELATNVSASAGYYWRSFFGQTVTDNINVTPADYDTFCITAPTDARLPNGGGYQVCGLYDVKQEKSQSVVNVTHRADKFGGASEVYSGFDLSMNARFKNGAVVSGGTSTGRTVLDNCGIALDSPQALLFCKPAAPFQTQVKAYVVYPLPWWHVQTSATLQSLPGPVITASYIATNAEVRPSLNRNLASGTGGTVTVPLIEPGTTYGPRALNLDVRASKIFRLHGLTFSASLDAYNVLNRSDVLQLDTAYVKETWQKPSVILGGRNFKGNIRIEF